MQPLVASGICFGAFLPTGQKCASPLSFGIIWARVITKMCRNWFALPKTIVRIVDRVLWDWRHFKYIYIYIYIYIYSRSRQEYLRHPLASGLLKFPVRPFRLGGSDRWTVGPSRSASGASESAAGGPLHGHRRRLDRVQF